MDDFVDSALMEDFDPELVLSGMEEHNALLLSNGYDPSIAVGVKDYDGACGVLGGAPEATMVIPNPDLFNSYACPFLLVMLMGCSENETTNYQLRWFLARIRMTQLISACVKSVLVIGLKSSMPHDFTSLPFSMFDDTHDYGPYSAVFHWIANCEECTKDKRGCSLRWECDGCEKKGVDCCLGPNEMVARARMLFEAVVGGDAIHSDLLYYQIFLQCGRYKTRKPITKKEALQLEARLGFSFPEKQTFGEPGLQYITPQIDTMSKENHLFHVMWLWDGEMSVASSFDWKRELGQPQELLALSAETRFPPLTVNTLMMNDVMGFWVNMVNAVRLPGWISEKRGLIFFRKMGLKGVVVKTVAHVYDFKHVVIATAIEVSK